MNMNFIIKNHRCTLLLFFCVLLVVSCKKATLPGVTTGTVNRITQRDAYSGGQVTSDGNDHITARGVCWSTTNEPTILDNKSSDSTGTGLFTSHITGLSASTNYYVRAYATNGEGTAYGASLGFTTDPVALAEISTIGLKSMTTTTAQCGGDISSDGGLTVTERGVCWNTTGLPTIVDSHSSDGTGAGAFYSTLTDLAVGTTYYVRAYATNNIGTAYGNQMTYVHIEPLTDNDGNVYGVVTIGTQIWMGENLATTTFNDGSPIPNVVNGIDWANTSTPAYCWYNNSAPSFKVPYGALYNWYAVNTGKLCPAGWRVPTSDDYILLLGFLGGENVAGGKMKEAGTVHWLTPNVGASNGSGFTALPGGGRYNVYSEGGSFVDLGMYGYHWSSSQGTNTAKGVSFDMSYMLNVVGKDEFPKGDGGSVRCIKNSR
jgi:uncharacterized protein (TIGR02145 family)